MSLRKTMTSWSKVSLSELGTLSRGKSRHRPRNDASLYGGEYPFIQTGDVKEANFYISHYSQTYNEKGLKQSKLWDKNTLCITIAANIAESALLSFPACFPDSIVGFIPHEKKSDVRFIKYLLDNYKSEFQKRSRGATQDNLSVEKINGLKVKAPEYVYQVKVAETISKYDGLIEKNQKRIKILEEMAQRLYTKWFVKFKFPGHENAKFVDSGTEFGEVPKGWEVKEIRDIGKVVTGSTPSKQRQEYYGSDYMLIKTPDFSQGIFVTDSDEKLSKDGLEVQKTRFLPVHTVMVSTIGTLGQVAITAEESFTNQQINSLVLDNKDDFVYFYFFAKNLKKKLEGLGSNGATMGNVSKSKFESIKILYPSSRLLLDFFALTSSNFSKIECLINTNDKLIKIRDLLIENFVTGKRLLNRNDETN